MNEQLAGERGNLAQVLRQEFADRLAASEEENRHIRTELAELRARQQLELEQLTRDKQAELEQVHGRWVQAGGGLRPACPVALGLGRRQLSTYPASPGPCHCRRPMWAPSLAEFSDMQKGWRPQKVNEDSPRPQDPCALPGLPARPPQVYWEATWYAGFGL